MIEDMGSPGQVGSNEGTDTMDSGSVLVAETNPTGEKAYVRHRSRGIGHA